MGVRDRALQGILRAMLTLLLLLLGLFSLDARSPPQDRGVKDLACTKKVQKICELRCANGCLNRNRRKPGKRLSKRAKRKYCSKVTCLPNISSTTECVCPMDLTPVCNDEGNQVADNMDCAICQGEDPQNLHPCMVTLGPVSQKPDISAVF